MRRLWLDDVRPEPNGWVRAKTAGAAVMHLSKGDFVEVSLDHDLGPETSGTGYDVVCWLEETIFTDPGFLVPVVHIHTSNPSARIKMLQAAEKIEFVRQQQVGER